MKPLFLARYFNTPGLFLGTLFFAFSLTPTLLPRSELIQGIISGVAFATGYGLAVFGHWLWLYLGLPRFRAQTRMILHWVAATLCTLVVIVFLWQATSWQNDVRNLMAMSPDANIRTLVVGFISMIVFLVLLIIARLFSRTLLFLSGKLKRFIPPRIAYLIGGVTAVMLFWSIFNGVLISRGLETADQSYRQFDALVEAGSPQPEAVDRPGGMNSLLDWDDLGRQGRRYLSFAPDSEQIQSVLPGEAMSALRVYVGMNSAETPEARAELALAELKRVGGFERSILVIVTPTGTGWIDPPAMETLEYLMRGDIASVAAQYSYLPSPLALTQEGAYGIEMAQALFAAIYNHWSSLPDQERPRLFLHGLSLGALNSDRSFELYDIIDDPFDGALWSGPPFRSETWRSVTARRDAGSPAWLPVFRDGAVVRFANQYQNFRDTPGEWGQFRIGFLQYASDPVTFFDPLAFFREPDWISDQRAPDVSDNMRWIPVVTMLQLAADISTGSSPRGFGHEYAAIDYLEAWIDLAEPELADQELDLLRAAYGQQEALLEPDGDDTIF